MPVPSSFLLAALLGAHLAPPPIPARDRIVEALGDGAVVRLQGSRPPLARPEFDVGRADSAASIEGVSLYFKPSPEQQASLEALLAAQQDPASPDYRKWITPEEYALRFGLAPGDLGRVIDWLSLQGFSAISVGRNRQSVSFSGTVGELEAAFRTEIHFFAEGAVLHFANATDLSLPAGLLGLVASVRHLDDYRPHPRGLASVLPQFTSSVSGNHFLTPDDFATIYDLQPLYQAGLDGTGVSIAVVGQTTVNTADLDAFRSNSGLAAKEPVEIIVPNSGTPVESSTDEVEADLDLEWSGGVARNAQIVYVFTGNASNYNAFDALDYAITNDLAPVISVSYGNCEPNFQQGATNFATTMQGWVQQANAQGQTVVAAAGDTGAADCDAQGASVATGGLAVDVPASIPEVTGLGGTEFAGDVTNATAYWNSTNNSSNGSAKGYIPEVVWNDTSVVGKLNATGGGVSTVFTKPSWQTGTGVPNDGFRDVPDVALNASPAHDSYLTCGPGYCVSPYGFRQSASGNLDAVGGTSAAAPSFAGILAIVNQATKSSGLGNVNPELYHLAATTSSVFHAITSGNNDVPCQMGTTDCTTGSYGYSAGTGYSQTVGLGSVDAYQLVHAFSGSPIQRTDTTTTLVPSATNVTAGTVVTFTATVTPATLTAAVGGTVQFAIDGQSVGSGVAVSSGQASAVSELAAGTHSIVASYSGDLDYLPSVSPAQTVVVTGTTTVSLVAPATTVAPKGSLTFGAVGGSPPYSWSLATNASGGTVSGGVYTAGAKGGVTDVVQVTDALGASAALAVTVAAGMAIAPTTASTPPRGSVTFSAQGGSGLGYAFTIASNNSGGSVKGAVYTAGPKGNVLDVVQVADSLGNVAAANVTVGQAIALDPTRATVAPGGSVSFSASGGSGSGFTWSLTNDASGGTVNTSTGAYVAGKLGGTVDVVQVTDSLGNTAAAAVTVTDSSGKGGCGSGGDAGALSLLALALAAAWRRSGGRARTPPGRSSS